MKICLSVCSLLACTTLGLLAVGDPIRFNFSDNVEVHLIDDNMGSYDKERGMNSLRFAREIEAFPRGLMVYDDDGNLVEVSLTTEGDVEVSEDEIRSKLDYQVKFRLYTRQNPLDYKELYINNKEAIASSHFNSEKPTLFITHGWVGSDSSPSCTLIKEAYLKNDDVNVIVVDWSKIAMSPYLWATRHVLMVGQRVAEMIDFLEAHARLDTYKTTLVGHSLGAHIMGLAGYYAKGTINYIVGLDPALPMFRFSKPGSRISTHDANHVQIIHTNAGFLGYGDAIGHSDFYPNGGSIQLGCIPDVGGACSHARSYKFFAESINSNAGFYGKPCNSYLQFLVGRCKSKTIAVMGGPQIDFISPGKYFLATKHKSLFARGI